MILSVDLFLKSGRMAKKGKGGKGGKGKGKGKKDAKPKEPFVPPWKLGKPLWYTQGQSVPEPGADEPNRTRTQFWRAAGLDEDKLQAVAVGGALPSLPGRSRPSSRESGHVR